jgi:hypothetical protein
LGVTPLVGGYWLYLHNHRPYQSLKAMRIITSTNIFPENLKLTPPHLKRQSLLNFNISPEPFKAFRELYA